MPVHKFRSFIQLKDSTDKTETHILDETLNDIESILRYDIQNRSREDITIYLAPSDQYTLKEITQEVYSAFAKKETVDSLVFEESEF